MGLRLSKPNGVRLHTAGVV